MARDSVSRRELLRTAGAAGATGLGVSVAGCTEGDQDTESPGTDPGMDTETDTDAGMDADTETETETATETEAEAAVTVEAAATDALGDVLVDGDGMALYMFEPDEQGASVCYDDCADAWPPLTVEDPDDVAAGPDVSADLGTVERDDGSLQVTADDWPLYYFASDQEPGDIAGQELGNVWFLLRPDGSVLRPTVSVREHDDLGGILTDAGGTTLYMFEPDEQGPSTCYGDCADAWPPLTVDSADDLVDSVRATADLGTVERDDGSLQVTADGWPLYYFVQDQEPGDATGQGANDVWFVLEPDGSVLRTGTGTPTATPSPTSAPTRPNDGSDDSDDGY